jgi:hypothetical protein
MWLRIPFRFLFLTFLCFHTASGQTPVIPGNCSPATAEAFLEVGNVRAKLLNNGGLFWNGGAQVYEVPKGANNNSIYAAGLWLAATGNDSLRVAASEFGPWEFWPGPITASSANSCAEYDAIWMLDAHSSLDIIAHPDSVVNRLKAQILAWPASLGAPYSDRNGVEGYQPLDGDRPLVRGDQTAWWLMNDAGNVHERSDAPVLGVEVASTAWAFDVSGPIGDATFYRYSIANRNAFSLDSLFVGFWSDVDIGTAFDDAVGTDTTYGMVYAFNLDDLDEGNYLERPPAIGFLPLEFLVSGASDNPSGEPPKFTNTMTYVDGGGPLSAPFEPSHFSRLLQSTWRDGTHLTIGGRGFNGTEPTNFIFPGDPVSGQYWSSFNIDGQGTHAFATDVRMMGSIGPVSLAPGGQIDFTVAIVWAQGVDHVDSITKLRDVAELVRSGATDLLATRPVSIPERRAPTPSFELAARHYPNPTAESLTIRYSVPQPMSVDISIFDALGRLVRRPQFGPVSEGEETLRIDISELARGVYYIRYRFDTIVETRPLTVL